MFLRAIITLTLLVPTFSQADDEAGPAFWSSFYVPVTISRANAVNVFGDTEMDLEKEHLGPYFRVFIPALFPVAGLVTEDWRYQLVGILGGASMYLFAAKKNRELFLRELGGDRVGKLRIKGHFRKIADAALLNRKVWFTANGTDVYDGISTLRIAVDANNEVITLLVRREGDTRALFSADQVKIPGRLQWCSDLIRSIR